MEASQSMRVKYHPISKRVEIARGDRQISIPGEHDTLDQAKAAVDAYARRYLVKK